MKSAAIIPMDTSGLKDQILCHEGNALNCLKKFFESKGCQFHTIDYYSDPAVLDAVITMDITPLFDAYKKKVYDHKQAKTVQILLLSECPVINQPNWDIRQHDFFDAIFTWRTDWIDNKRYFGWTWIQNGYKEFPKQTDIKTFLRKKRKLLTLVNANKHVYHPDELYSQRLAAIRFFESRIPEQFDLFGRGWNKPLPVNPFSINNMIMKFTKMPFLKSWIRSFTAPRSYRGEIADKFAVLSQYRFSICYENMKNIQGYITEKIWDSFRARAVPVYWGASNVEDYIPSDCFIDKRQFSRYDELLSFITNMDNACYAQYIRAIDRFIKTDSAKVWFDEYWAQKLGNKIWDIIQSKQTYI